MPPDLLARVRLRCVVTAGAHATGCASTTQRTHARTHERVCVPARGLIMSTACLPVLCLHPADGKSYNNKCLAECAKVTVMPQAPDNGKCPQGAYGKAQSQPQPASKPQGFTCRCAKMYKPVCGSGVLHLRVACHASEQGRLSACAPGPLHVHPFEQLPLRRVSPPHAA